MKLFFILLLIVFLVSCTNNNPNVIYAKEKCSNLTLFYDGGELGPQYDCYLNLSLKFNNTDICYLLNAGVADLCVSDYKNIKKVY